MNLILASQSPQRQQLLKQAGYSFEVFPIDFQEPIPNSSDPNDIATYIAFYKGKEASQILQKKLSVQELEKSVVLTADTIVYLNGKVYGKPKDEQEAFKMLWELSREPHIVVSGVCVWPLKEKEKGLVAADTTHIRMQKISEKEIYEYIATGEWIGRAGAFAIQGIADKFVEEVQGNLDNVIGLPMQIVQNLLHKIHYE
ncbi:MAG TPA: Maf family protein [Planctomycetota bacterium]|nr:Maf family protein [Planctomycetota bacterium]HQA99776.1 Maf family protein [Planctomycetota bacterium]